MKLFERKEGVAANEPAPLIYPLTAYRLMLVLLESKDTKTPNFERQIWQDRTEFALKAMLPYVESVFTVFKSVPGVDITDTACKVRIENEVPYERLEGILDLRSVKMWLSLHEGEAGWDTLYTVVHDIPGFESLTFTHDVESSHFAYITMVAQQILHDLYVNHLDLIASE